MKTLVIYYSLDGNTRFIAEAIAAETGADILELKPVKSVSGGRASKIFWGSKQVVFKEKPEIEPIDKNPADYDLIFFGTPVWVGTFTPPFNTFFEKYKLTGKKTALFCTFGGGPSRTFSNFKKALAGNEVLGEIGFKEPLKHNKEGDAAKAREWSRTMIFVIK